MFGFFEPREMLRSFEPRGIFGCTSGTVSYATELTSVSMCYSLGDGFNTSLFGLLYLYCTLSQSLHVVFGLLSLSGVCGYVRWHGHGLPRTTLIKIMCVHQLYHQR